MLAIFLIYTMIASVLYFFGAIWAIWKFEEVPGVLIRNRDAEWSTFHHRLWVGFGLSIIWPATLLFITVRRIKKIMRTSEQELD